MGKKYRVGCKGLDEYARGKVVFNNCPFAVPYFLPGEKGDIELVFRMSETSAKLVSIDTPSEDRVETGCPVYETCGGCQMMHMKYEKQLEWKQSRIEELFAKEKEEGKIAPIIPMEHPWNYRHKIYASFSTTKKGELLAGIYEENSHKVVQTQSCRIQNELANQMIAEIVSLMKKTGTTAYNEDKKKGIIRHVYIRVGEKTGQVMLVIVTGSVEFPAKNVFVEQLTKKFKQITTIIQNINNARTSMILGKKETVLYGTGTIEDELCGLTFEISSSSFYQVNPIQTEKLYETAIAFAGLTGEETVLDTYCGIGTISLVAAKQAKEVIGVEVNDVAWRDAKKNAKKNGCGNVKFVSDDASDYMVRLAKGEVKLERKPNVVFMDPPRSGSDPKFLNAVAQLAPEKIVYISCNPVTQKVDADILKKKGYQIEKIQAVDCFCHTYHVECIIMMQYCGKEKKK